ncbi:MAG TPA: heparan-alpha-glucosaminide N-acetyltransferase domain-containing protein [Bryobacteraceae bacterium]|nr:heparan-alpha-glucosaminide N-acetyltransferase domain-containing protein [Bryobacteraceae bacterium]
MPSMRPLDSGPKGRLESLDVFRGATIAAMILVNNPGSFQTTYAPLLHAQWNGWTFTDVIFPSFLWIAGVAMTLSFRRRMERGEDRATLLRHVLRRAAIIFALGLFLNAFPHFQLATLRIPGVLQRIAVCYLAAAAILLYTSARTQLAILVSLLAGYWILMKTVPVPGYGAGVLEPEGNLAQWIDSRVLAGHMWSHTKTWDPEGILSTLPSIATVLFGVFTGHVLRRTGASIRTLLVLAVSGLLLVFSGELMDVWFPINKNLWSPSFAVLMAGISTLVFTACYWLVDIKRIRAWARPFAIYGMNAIAIYVLAGVLADTLSILKVPAGGETISLWNWIYTRMFVPLANPFNASLLFALTFVLVLYAVAYFLYRRGRFIKV